MPAYPAVRATTFGQHVNTIVIPSQTAEGDLIIAHYYDNSAQESAMTSAGFTKVASSGTNYAFYKYADATDAGGHTYTASHSAYFLMLVLSNATYKAGNTAWTESAPTLTHNSVKPASGFVLCGWYGVSGFTPQSGWTKIHEDFTGAYETMVARRDGIENPTGTVTVTPTGGAGGARYSTMIVAEVKNAKPSAPSNLVVGGSPGDATIPVSWTHSDPEGDPQSKYKVKWRKVN